MTAAMPSGRGAGCGGVKRVGIVLVLAGDREGRGGVAR